MVECRWSRLTFCSWHIWPMYHVSPLMAQRTSCQVHKASNLWWLLETTFCHKDINILNLYKNDITICIIHLWKIDNVFIFHHNCVIQWMQPFLNFVSAVRKRELWKDSVPELHHNYALLTQWKVVSFFLDLATKHLWLIQFQYTFYLWINFGGQKRCWDACKASNVYMVSANV